MPVLAPERAEEVLAGWRRGEELDGLASPAGPMFPDGYTEADITLTGGGSTGGGGSLGGTCDSTNAIISCLVECC